MILNKYVFFSVLRIFVLWYCGKENIELIWVHLTDWHHTVLGMIHLLETQLSWCPLFSFQLSVIEKYYSCQLIKDEERLGWSGGDHDQYHCTMNLVKEWRRTYVENRKFVKIPSLIKYSSVDFDYIWSVFWQFLHISTWFGLHKIKGGLNEIYF